MLDEQKLGPDSQKEEYFSEASNELGSTLRIRTLLKEQASQIKSLKVENQLLRQTVLQRSSGSYLQDTISLFREYIKLGIHTDRPLVGVGTYYEIKYHLE